MKPLYIMTGDDVRSRLATADEIQEFIDDPDASRWGRQLATVSMDASGKIVATPLTIEELQRLGADYHADQIARLRKLLDAALTFRREALVVKGVMRFTIWAADAPWAEDVVRDWADARRLRIDDETPPAKAEHWIRTLIVRDGDGFDAAVVKIQWPSVRVGADMMIVEGIERMSQAIALLGAADTESF